MSAISNSSDVWATLVANIAPLLILVGEGHVKAYFKTMCRTSHHILFASAPIGLVTAVVTLIRLSGSPVLKRIIGRQFETRAQVLIDVTSVSSGEVGLELVNMNLEQSIVPTPANLAMFWVHGKRRGRAAEIAQWVQDLDTPMRSMAFRIVRTSSDNYERRCAWTVLSAFRAKGPGAIWMARKYALLAQHSLSEDEREFLALCESQLGRDPSSNTTCEAAGCVYARWSDVSLVLTASENLDRGLFDVLRYTVAVLSLLGNVGIIVASWYISHDGRNVGLVAAGLFISSAGSWLTAWLVDEASNEEIIDLSAFSACNAGFFSEQIHEGVTLSFCPRVVVMSTDHLPSQRGSFQYRRLATAIVVGLMVMAYIGLYLGLRALTWWLSLAMLGVSAITALARSLLVPASLFLQQPRPSLSPEPTFLTPNLQPRNALEFPQAQVSSVTSALATPSIPPQQPRDIRSEPLLIGDVYEVVYTKFNVHDLFQQSLDNSYARLLGTSLQIAYEMRERNIAPLEWEYLKNHKIKEGCIITLYSDLISQRGVWRQPLELVMLKPFSGRGLGTILSLVAGWNSRADATSAQKIAELSMDPSIKNHFLSLDDSEEKIGNVTDGFKLPLRDFTASSLNLWMIVKIMYGVTYDSVVEGRDRHLTEYSKGQTDARFDKQKHVLFLDSIVAAGLTCSHSQVGIY